jgi:hypothetical protein
VGMGYVRPVDAVLEPLMGHADAYADQGRIYDSWTSRTWTSWQDMCVIFPDTFPMTGEDRSGLEGEDIEEPHRMQVQRRSLSDRTMSTFISHRWESGVVTGS